MVIHDYSVTTPIIIILMINLSCLSMEKYPGVNVACEIAFSFTSVKLGHCSCTMAGSEVLVEAECEQIGSHGLALGVSWSLESGG